MVDLAESSGDYYYSCRNMNSGFEPLGLGKSSDKVLLADIDFLAGKAADSAGIVVIAATVDEKATESTRVLGDRKDLVAEDTLVDYIDLHHNLAMAHEAVETAVAPGILL